MPFAPAFHVTQHAAQEPTRVEIDAKATGPTLSPLLFGHNLEHTRRAIWQGISAEMIANRKFAAVDSGLPVRWRTLSGDGVSIDDNVAYTGKHSVRLEGANRGIWQQHEWLTFRQGEKYAFRVWIKSNADQKLQMEIFDRPRFNAILVGETVARSGNWRLWSGEFTSPVLARGARFQLYLTTPGPVWIGAASLMPADNFHGMRRDVVELFKTLKPGGLRWPGGCFAEYYNWKEGLLPVDQRPPIGPGQWVGLLPDTDGYDNHEIGTDEYVALCRELNCEPVITIRYGEGSPEEAAAWVEYCNGGPETRLGKIRTGAGHPEPYKVKYWFVGNEIWGMSLVKNKDPKVCTALSRRFANAMRKADPGIQCIRCAPFLDQAWQKPILKEMAESAEFPELIQDGCYISTNNMAQTSKAPPCRSCRPCFQNGGYWIRQTGERTPSDSSTTNGTSCGIGRATCSAASSPRECSTCSAAKRNRCAWCSRAIFSRSPRGPSRSGRSPPNSNPMDKSSLSIARTQGNRLLKTSPTMAADADIDLCAR